MADKLKQGDKVEWNTSYGKATGTLRKKRTSPIELKGYGARAFDDNPEYLVESEKSEGQAAHKPDALSRL